MRYTVACLVGILLLLGHDVCRADVFYSEGFESFPDGSIDGRGMTWSSDNDGVVVSDNAHTGSKALRGSDTGARATYFGYFDDTNTAPHGNLFEVSWYMKRTVLGEFDITIKARNTETVALMSNNDNYGGSRSSLKARTLDVDGDPIWEETLAILPADTYRKVTVQVDFTDGPVEYRLGVGESPAWQGWYSMGPTADYFRSIEFNFRNNSGATVSAYVDDFTFSEVPEPSTFALFSACGLAAVLVGWRKRKRT